MSPPHTNPKLQRQKTPESNLPLRARLSGFPVSAFRFTKQLRPPCATIAPLRFLFPPPIYTHVCCTAGILASIALRDGAHGPVDDVIMDESHDYSTHSRGTANPYSYRFLVPVSKKIDFIFQNE